MKLLLTSAGLTNESIRTALTQLTGKPTAQSNVTIVPTAMHAVSGGGRYLWDHLVELHGIGWQSVSVLELTALASLPEDLWLGSVEDADVIMVDGGNTPYLSYWFEKSGFAKILPSLLENRVYFGVSAGSLVVSGRLVINEARRKETGVYADEQYGDVAPFGFGSDFTLNLVPAVFRARATYSFTPGSDIACLTDWD